MYELWTCESVWENLLENIIKVWNKAYDEFVKTRSPRANPPPSWILIFGAGLGSTFLRTVAQVVQWALKNLHVALVVSSSVSIA